MSASIEPEGLGDFALRIAEAVKDDLRSHPPTPSVTYRLQFQPQHLTFRDAAALAPYLQSLGVSHVYASPYLMATPGASHGYEVVDHGRLNPELGSEQEYRELVETLHRHGLGQILDIVPNHMGIAAAENRWWFDVLENGPSSPYSHYFDIDWHPVKSELRNKVMLPLLAQQYGHVLESGDLHLQRDGGTFLVKCDAMTLPLEPKSYAALLSLRLDELRSEFEPESADLMELESILTALDNLPNYTDVDRESMQERQREKEVVKGRLARLCEDSSAIASALDRTVETFNGRPGDPRSFDRLDNLLDQQVYRLCHWKAASDEINYRRFFDVNAMAALCVEEPDVFRQTHRFILQLLGEGAIDGLRIDHIDGLFDPEEYLWRLQWGYVRALARRAYDRVTAPAADEGGSHRGSSEVAASRDESSEAPESTAGERQYAGPERGGADDSTSDQPWRPGWEQLESIVLATLHRDIGGPRPEWLFPSLGDTDASEESGSGGATWKTSSSRATASSNWTRSELPLYVVVEKILESDEDIPDAWAVAGTTGYEFLNSVSGLFVDSGGMNRVRKRYRTLTGQKGEIDDVVYHAKQLMIDVAMAAELQLLAVRLSRLSERDRRFRDFTLNNLRTALREIIACFPVYRTYITAVTSAGVSERDRRTIETAVRRARRRNPNLDARLFAFVRGVLLLELPPNLDEPALQSRRFFVGRFQQVTSPVMAKGVEDTAFYRYFPLSALNEVGGDPDHVTTVDEFHAENLTRYRRRAGSLLCSTSHDAKRSEDTRARISVLSEIPQRWRDALRRWMRLNRRHRSEVDGEPAPSRNDEYLFYQTLVGVWPLEPPDANQLQRLVGRIEGYMEKAIHEAKLRTSWINPDADYDEAVRQFVRKSLEETPRNRFLNDFRALHEAHVDAGLNAALAQLVLKLTAPGVPDLYQGQELWDFSLVDPDNRRPVDYDRRRRLLEEIRRATLHAEHSLAEFAAGLASNPRDDRLKLYVTWRALQFRRAEESLFRSGRYVPLRASGSAADHVVAFAWHRADESGSGGEGENPAAVIAVPRLLTTLSPDAAPWTDSEIDPSALWGDTAIHLESAPDVPLTNLFTGRQPPIDAGLLRAADLFADFPAALLAKKVSGLFLEGSPTHA